jgi:hypothetical protein
LDFINYYHVIFYGDSGLEPRYCGETISNSGDTSEFMLSRLLRQQNVRVTAKYV